VSRHAHVQVDLSAIAHNVEELCAVAGAARLCAVVKADGYGHGAVEVARTAVAHGATMLAVALVDEGAPLREAGIDAPILVLSEPPVDALRDAWELGLTPTLYHEDAVARAAEVVPGGGRWGVQLKVDTGMHRVGLVPDRVVDVAAAVVASPRLVLDGVFTHLAVADEPDRPETTAQLGRFDAVISDLRAKGIDPGTVHAANSAGLIAHPAARYAMVRAGIAVYGLAPAPRMEGMVDLRPAMSVISEVSHVAVVPAGDGVSYGLRHVFDRDTMVATVPVGYADGVSRRLWSTGGEVLIGGVRRPIRGVVTMDQLMVELGPAPGGAAGPAGAHAAVARGDEVVLLGRQAGPDGVAVEEITAGEWAGHLDTIAYEVVCGFGPRLPRRYVR
jgi:alanine racemase